ncbi:MAG TPA: hypothetical protein VFJ29_03920 [Candidatus Kapabacteria bacterium]|nr:hypothetical protein [Candidatus Kapabacteria bacterium]
MQRFNTSVTRFIGVFLLSAYSLLLCEEVFHTDVEPCSQASATINDGTSHFAHRIITDSPKECAVCQSAVSQIHTETFHADPSTVSFIVEYALEASNPARNSFYSVSLRAPPICA